MYSIIGPWVTRVTGNHGKQNCGKGVQPHTQKQKPQSPVKQQLMPLPMTTVKEIPPGAKQCFRWLCSLTEWTLQSNQYILQSQSEHQKQVLHS